MLLAHNMMRPNYIGRRSIPATNLLVDGPLIALLHDTDISRTETLSSIHSHQAQTFEVHNLAIQGVSLMNETNLAPLLNICTSDPAIARDDEIVLAAQAGVPGAFAELHAIYSRRLYKRVLAMTGSREDAEDALQETFLRVHSAIHAFEGRSSIYSWLTRIAINCALLILRRRRARAEILFDPQADAGSEAHGFEFKDSAPNPEQVYDLHQRRVMLRRAIPGLNAQLRTPLEMLITKGSPIKEIGQALNISEAAVKTRLHRARRQLSMHVGRRDAGVKTSLRTSMTGAPGAPIT